MGPLPLGAIITKDLLPLGTVVITTDITTGIITMIIPAMAATLMITTITVLLATAAVRPLLPRPPPRQARSTTTATTCSGTAKITHDHEEDRHQGKNSDKCIHCKPVIKAVNTTDTRAAANSAFNNRNGGARTLNNKSGNIIKAGSKKTVEVVPTFVEEDVAEEDNDDEENAE
ncbi:hypothetical protein ACHAPB_000879 [Verticillium nonalfalfae]